MSPIPPGDPPSIYISPGRISRRRTSFPRKDRNYEEKRRRRKEKSLGWAGKRKGLSRTCIGGLNCPRESESQEQQEASLQLAIRPPVIRFGGEEQRAAKRVSFPRTYVLLQGKRRRRNKRRFLSSISDPFVGGQNHFLFPVLHSLTRDP